MPLALARVVAALDAIAPLHLAAEWDNVGVLLDHARPRRVGRAMLAIDLTQPVLDEAIAARCELIVAYHPPIFRPLSRLTNADPKQRVVLRAARAGIAIHSPHTALDAADGGVNDWLADALGSGARRSIESAPAGGGQRIVATLPADAARSLAGELSRLGADVELEGDGDGVASVVAEGGGDAARRALDGALAELPTRWQRHATVWRLEPRLRASAGQGRLVELDTAAPLGAIVRRIKRWLGLPKLRVAAATAHAADGPGDGDGDGSGATVRTVALCAGAGGAVVSGQPADLYLTGEMRHHDVLAALERGTSVVLCDHSNTERGYLPRLAERLREALDGRVEVLVSASDAEPLRVV